MILHLLATGLLRFSGSRYELAPVILQARMIEGLGLLSGTLLGIVCIFCVYKGLDVQTSTRWPNKPWLSQLDHIICRSLAFSSSPPKMTSMPLLARAQMSALSRPKCSATRPYSFDSGLPKTPTSSVCVSLECQFPPRSFVFRWYFSQ